MTDVQPERPGGGNGLADVDGKVSREYGALSDLLLDLARRNDAPGLPLIAEPRDPEELSRWVFVLQGVDRLAEVSAIREELLKIPYCIAIRVTDVTPEETRAILTATSTVEAPELEEMLIAAIQLVGSLGVVQSVAKYVPAGD